MALEPIRTFFLCATVPTLIGQPQALFSFLFPKIVPHNATQKFPTCAWPLGAARRLQLKKKEPGSGLPAPPNPAPLFPSYSLPKFQVRCTARPRCNWPEGLGRAQASPWTWNRAALTGGLGLPGYRQS